MRKYTLEHDVEIFVDDKGEVQRTRFRGRDYYKMPRVKKYVLGSTPIRELNEAKAAGILHHPPVIGESLWGGNESGEIFLLPPLISITEHNPTRLERRLYHLLNPQT